MRAAGFAEKKRCSTCRRTRPVVLDTDGHGGVVDATPPCGWCARKRAGICQRCHRRPVKAKKGHGLYCAPCYQPAINERVKRKRAEKDPLRHAGICADCREAPVDGKVGWAVTCAPCRDERKRARARAYYQDDAEKRAARNEYKRQWRAQNRAKVKLQKRRSALRGRTAERMRRYRERVAAGEHTPTRTRWSGDGRRLCLTDGCPSVMEGRAKLCRACKEARAAA